MAPGRKSRSPNSHRSGNIQPDHWSISNIQYNHPTEYQKWIEMGIEASKIHQNPMKSGPIMPDPDFRSGLQS